MNNGSYTVLGMDITVVFLILLVIQIVLILLVISSRMHIHRMKRNYTKFMRGNDGSTLESAIISKFQEFDEFSTLCKENSRDIKRLMEESALHFQKVGIVRYNAFVEMGGNLSFVLSILDAHNNGWIMNVMHSRDGCYTYVKEVVKGKSFVSLADEEKESLAQAMQEDELE